MKYEWYECRTEAELGILLRRIGASDSEIEETVSHEFQHREEGERLGYAFDGYSVSSCLNGWYVVNPNLVGFPKVEDTVRIALAPDRPSPEDRSMALMLIEMIQRTEPDKALKLFQEHYLPKLGGEVNEL